MAGSNTTATPRGNGAVRYLRNVRGEMKKVVWPSRRELVSFTIVVFVSVIIVAVLIGVVDSIFSEFFKVLFHTI